MKSHTEFCAICGIPKCIHHKFEGNEDHTVWKRSGSASWRMCQNHYKWYSGKTNNMKCKKYGGLCPQNNFCYALKNSRGGDFGWGECIYKEVKE